MLKNILFDLDGTIMDPAEGFVKCIRYALDEMGMPSPEDNNIAKLIGPPLQSTFEKLLRSTDPDLIDKAVQLYRKRYAEKGIFENFVYPGVMEMLEYLHTNRFYIWIVTFKPEIWTGKIVHHYSIDRVINGIYGPDLHERLHDKIQMIRSVLSSNTLTPEHTVMIGDRKEDIIAGRENNITTIGVTYGYGSREEITDAQPDYICDTPAEIQQVIQNH